MLARHFANRSKTAIVQHPDLTDLRSHEARTVLSRFQPVVIEMSIEDEKGLLCDRIERLYPGLNAKESRIQLFARDVRMGMESLDQEHEQYMQEPKGAGQSDSH
jgi:hypothetical protein